MQFPGCGRMTHLHRVSAVIAKGKHPVPFRTRKLSPSAPMVLRGGPRGRVGRRRTCLKRVAPDEVERPSSLVWILWWQMLEVGVAEGRGTPKGRRASSDGRKGGSRTGGAAQKTARTTAGAAKTPRRNPRPTGTSGSTSYGRGRAASGRTGQEPRTGRTGQEPRTGRTGQEPRTGRGGSGRDGTADDGPRRTPRTPAADAPRRERSSATEGSRRTTGRSSATGGSRRSMDRPSATGGSRRTMDRPSASDGPRRMTRASASDRA